MHKGGTTCSTGWPIGLDCPSPAGSWPDARSQRRRVHGPGKPDPSRLRDDLRRPPRAHWSAGPRRWQDRGDLRPDRTHLRVTASQSRSAAKAAPSCWRNSLRHIWKAERGDYLDSPASRTTIAENCAGAW